eukprot:SAG22_NODE_15403_length_349_cov_1.036000_1_plen_50_part_10
MRLGLGQPGQQHAGHLDALGCDIHAHATSSFLQPALVFAHPLVHLRGAPE